MDPDITALRALLDAAQRVVVFTGAGISTESGIPDFRSPGGVWDQMKPIMFQDFCASAAMRREAWRRRFASDPVMRAAEPSLELLGRRLRLVEPVARGRRAGRRHGPDGVPLLRGVGARRTRRGRGQRDRCPWL